MRVNTKFRNIVSLGVSPKTRTLLERWGQKWAGLRLYAADEVDSALRLLLSTEEPSFLFVGNAATRFDVREVAAKLEADRLLRGVPLVVAVADTLAHFRLHSSPGRIDAIVREPLEPLDTFDAFAKAKGPQVAVIDFVNLDRRQGSCSRERFIYRLIERRN